MAEIFLTGGTGLLGLHILDQLVARQIPVKALVRDAAGEKAILARGAIPVLGRVEDPAMWNAVEGCRGIIHGAAVIAGREPWDRYVAINVEGTRFAASRARALGVPLVHISSVAVYGRNYRPGQLIVESSPFAALSERDFYARSKRMAEDVLWQEAERGLRAVAIRPCVVYGEGDRLFLPKVTRQMARQWRVPLIGDGDRPLALVHAANVAQAVMLALETPAAWGQAYNTTNDDTITSREFVAAVGRGLGRELKTIRLPAAPVTVATRVLDRVNRFRQGVKYPGSVSTAVRYWRGGNPYSSEKACRELGWSPSVKHAEGVERAVRSIKEKGPA